MERHPSAGLIYGSQMHHLDHLAALCCVLKIPLVVTEKKLESAAKTYYPFLKTLCFDSLEIGERIIQKFDVVFSSLPEDIFRQIFFVAENLHGKELLNIWCPHGNSDKGHYSFFMEALNKEKIALVYGQKMVDFLIEKGAYSQLYASIFLGNYRYEFYKRHAAFYDQIVNSKIASCLPKNRKTILYSPTWQDAENSCSFFQVFPLLLKALPRNFNLIVKLHPNMLEKRYILEPYLSQIKSGVLILEEFPPIYPLLNFVDIYLGDMSSIGYDFLTFNKPMFFLTQNRRDPRFFLFQGGVCIDSDQYEDIFSIIKKTISQKQTPYSKKQKEMYRHVFGKKLPLNMLRKTIIETYEQYLKREFSLH